MILENMIMIIFVNIEVTITIATFAYYLICASITLWPLAFWGPTFVFGVNICSGKIADLAQQAKDYINM